MSWLAFVASIPLLAFVCWLAFNLVLVKWHGLEALEKTRKLHQFRPGEWFVRRLPPDRQPPDELPPAA